MGSKKINCWEFTKCGRGPDGAKGEKCEACPAALHSSLDGFNQGLRAGRACWLVAGTFCDGKVSGTYAEKIESCRECEFYKEVNKGAGQTRLTIGNVDIFGSTHLGLVRKTNEDRYMIRQMEDESILMAVADGLGGGVSSDYAAEIAKARLVGLKQLTTGRERQELDQMARDLDLIISDKAQKEPELEAMATTLVCAILKDDHIHWVNVGDSRLYVLRDGKLVQVTEDQTLAKFLVEEGELTPEQAKEHYSSDVLDQCVGYGECEPETASFEIRKNDLLILSTDGLHKMVPGKTFLSILNASIPIEEKTGALIRAALDSGGKDNITIVMAIINPILK
ncbi:MAG: serine/threonine-protein phosphatase [Desulfobacteraceae bacterium]|nr:serine/threonine-protein phosphatase [Desulfobacteraceae bacterium]